jgi:two-component system, cell cycle sensor histidine kinase and response regulator CckA
VDDEQMIRDSGKRMLESLGCRVLVAEEGSRALEIYTQRRGEIDLVILDLVMPGMDGSETFTHLRELDPEARVWLCSGYSQLEHADALLGRGALGFLQKPFDLEELSAAIAAGTLTPQSA